MQDKFQWLPWTFHKEFIHPTYTHIAKNKKKELKKRGGGGQQTYYSNSKIKCLCKRSFITTTVLNVCKYIQEQ